MQEKLVTWDLTPLYRDVESWEKDFARLDEMARHFYSFRGRLAESPETLKAAIESSDAFDRLAEKLHSYAHLLSDEDTTVGVNRARVDKLCAKLAALSEFESYFEPEIMAIPDGRMKELLDAPELAFYRRSLEELLREKPHTLSEKEEKLLNEMGKGASEITFFLATNPPPPAAAVDPGAAPPENDAE